MFYNLVLAFHDFFEYNKNLERWNCLGSLRNLDMSEHKNAFFPLWSLLWTCIPHLPVPCPSFSLESPLDGVSHHPFLGAFRVPFSLSLDTLPWMSPQWALFQEPLPHITKTVISRVCGALCRGAYGASCIINNTSATHVFYQQFRLFQEFLKHTLQFTKILGGI